MSQPLRILVTGALGQVGSELKALQPTIENATWFFSDRDELDITQPEAVEALFSIERFNVVLNCAAFTAVDKAESEPLLSQALNADAVATLARCCAAYGALLLHLSTDYVYSAQNRPYIETDATAPQSVYASTKLAGDVAALALNPKSVVLRTSWVYSAYGHNFVKTMMRLGAERPQLSVVFDQVGTPTYAQDLALAMLQIVQQWQIAPWEAGDEHYGVFHFSNEGVTSWYDFAIAIQEIAGNTCEILPITSEQYPTPAQRPFYSVLNKQKIKTVYQLNIPHWRAALQRCMDVI